MTAIESLPAAREELETRAEQYFISVEDAFRETIRRLGKTHPATAIEIALAVFVLLSIIPLTPTLLIRLLGLPPGNATPRNFAMDFNRIDHLLVWFLSIAGSVFIFVAANRITKKWKIRRDSLALPNEILPFCHLFRAYGEIKRFLINQRDVHIDLARKDLGAYLLRGEFRYRSGSFNISTSALISSLLQNYPWFKLVEETHQVVQSFKEFDLKIKRRFFQKVELDRVIPALRYLMLYEYSKVKKVKEERLSGSRLSVAELGYNCLYEYVGEMSRLGEIVTEPKDIAKRPLLKYYQSVIEKSRALLESQNRLVRFASWYLLLLIIFSASVLIALAGFHLKPDTTVMVGIVSAPFIGAVTFAASPTKRG